MPEEAEMPAGPEEVMETWALFCTVILVSEEEVLFMMPAYVAVISSALASMRMLPWELPMPTAPDTAVFPADGQKRQGRISLSHGDGRIISGGISGLGDGFFRCLSMVIGPENALRPPVVPMAVTRACSEWQSRGCRYGNAGGFPR